MMTTFDIRKEYIALNEFLERYGLHAEFVRYDSGLKDIVITCPGNNNYEIGGGGSPTWKECMERLSNAFSNQWGLRYPRKVVGDGYVMWEYADTKPVPPFKSARELLMKLELMGREI